MNSLVLTKTGETSGVTMAGQPLGGYVGSEKAAAIRHLEKKRDALFEQSAEERRRLESETAAYRLKGTADKFSSASNAADVSLQQATVGLVSKSDFARIRERIEGGASAAAADANPSTAAAPTEAAEKKKKALGFDVFKAHQGVLSFAFEEDGDDADGGSAVALPPPKKPKSAVAASAEADATAVAQTAPSPPHDRR